MIRDYRDANYHSQNSNKIYTYNFKFLTYVDYLWALTTQRKHLALKIVLVGQNYCSEQMYIFSTHSQQLFPRGTLCFHSFKCYKYILPLSNQQKGD